jgi:hypothetical protein
MAVVTNPILLIPAVAGLLALTQTAGDAGFSAESQFTTDARAPISSTLEASKAENSLPVMFRMEAPKDIEMREATPLSCLQIQTIDEVELISEPTPDADCE